MTTPTATSEQAGLPDAGQLASLASTLFREPPGAAAAAPSASALPAFNLGAPPAPGSVPVAGALNPQPQATMLQPTTPPVPVSQAAVAQYSAPPAVLTPRLLPTHAQTPDAGGIAATAVPAVPGFAAVPALAPTSARPSATPAAGPAYYFLEGLTGSDAPAPTAPPSAVPNDLSLPTFAGAPLPSTPYYFIGESSGHRAGPSPQAAFDVHAVRRDFPILAERVNGRPLVWFDNAATTQKPQAVIDRLAHFYAHENSNIHRAAHELAARATDAYEAARHKVARFLGASSVEEIIFVRGATEAINLVAASWGRANVGEGDEILVSHLEHHANIVPWQMLAAEKGAKLRVIPVDDSGQLRLDEYRRLLNPRTRIVAVTQVSNALGTITPVHDIVELGHRAGARVLIDGAQAVSHLGVDMQTLGADFYVFSGHKVFGPTGIGVVYGKREVLEDMPPYQGGGNMIEDVTFEQTRYHGPPMRFEAGTGNIADAVGLGAALDYVSKLGLERIASYEHALLDYGTALLKTIPGLRLIGTAAEKTSVMSFTLAGHSTEEVGKALNQHGIAVRAGHHCAQPILRRFSVEATVRPSIAFYNTHDEIDSMIAVLRTLAARR